MFANKRRKISGFPQASNRRPPAREARILTTGGVNKLFKEWTMCIHCVVLRKKLVIVIVGHISYDLRNSQELKMCSFRKIWSALLFGRPLWLAKMTVFLVFNQRRTLAGDRIKNCSTESESITNIDCEYATVVYKLEYTRLMPLERTFKQLSLSKSRNIHF